MLGMWKGTEDMKIPLFFRTRDQLDSLVEAVKEINDTIRHKVGWLDAASWVQLTTKYTNKSPVYDSIPKSKPGDKKYIAVIRANKHKMQQYNIDIEEKFASLDGIEFVDRGNNEPKYTGETTTKDYTITSYDEFRAITAVFNKGFGAGNWRIKGGPKKFQSVLKQLDAVRKRGPHDFGFNPYRGKYKDGVPVKLVVNQPDADLNKYLFKVKLK